MDLKGVRGHLQGFRGRWEGRPVPSRWAAATARLSRGRLKGVCARMRQAVLPTPGSPREEGGRPGESRRSSQGRFCAVELLDR